jgi:hypothetical protein
MGFYLLSGCLNRALHCGPAACLRRVNRAHNRKVGTMEQTYYTDAGNVKLCPYCGKPMQVVEVKTSHRNYKLSTCVSCIKEADKKRQKEGV